LADVVLLAVIVGDAFVIGISGDDDTGGGGACEMFVGIETVFSTETIVIPFTGNGDADVLAVTDEVFALGVAFIALSAFVGGSSIDDGAEVSYAFHMLCGLQTIPIGGTSIVSCSTKPDAGIPRAHRMRNINRRFALPTRPFVSWSTQRYDACPRTSIILAYYISTCSIKTLWNHS
jgi:hypothetical protein